MEPWVLDTKAMLHSMPNHHTMLNYVVGDFNQMLMVDDGLMDIVRKSDVNLITLNNIEH